MSKTTTKQRKQTKTEKVLVAMLCENTGRALCDSGGIPKYDANGKYIGSEQGYGRSYERNRGRDFDREPAVNFDVSDIQCHDGTRRLSFEISVNVYHWLKERLTYDAALNRKYENFAKKLRAEESEFSIAKAFPKHLRTKGHHVTGLYGDEVEDFEATNTYNGEDALTQTLQYVYFEVDRTPYVALQIHGGADVRGGYTNAKIFEVSEETSMFDNGRLSMAAWRPEDADQLKLPFMEGVQDVHQVVWDSDNGGYSFYLSDGNDLWDRKNKGPCPKIKCDPYKTDGSVFPLSTDMSLRGQGYVVLDPENNKIYCPVSGWELIVSFY